MSLGEVVVWLPEPFALGTGTVMGLNEIGWIEVVWQNGELGIYCPNCARAGRRLGARAGRGGVRASRLTRAPVKMDGCSKSSMPSSPAF